MFQSQIWTQSNRRAHFTNLHTNSTQHRAEHSWLLGLERVCKLLEIFIVIHSRVGHSDLSDDREQHFYRDTGICGGFYWINAGHATIVEKLCQEIDSRHERRDGRHVAVRWSIQDTLFHPAPRAGPIRRLRLHPSHGGHSHPISGFLVPAAQCDL